MFRIYRQQMFKGTLELWTCNVLRALQQTRSHLNQTLYLFLKSRLPLPKVAGLLENPHVKETLIFF